MVPWRITGIRLIIWKTVKFYLGEPWRKSEEWPYGSRTQTHTHARSSTRANTQVWMMQAAGIQTHRTVEPVPKPSIRISRNSSGRIFNHLENYSRLCLRILHRVESATSNQNDEHTRISANIWRWKQKKRRRRKRRSINLVNGINRFSHDTNLLLIASVESAEESQRKRLCCRDQRHTSTRIST